MRLWCFLLFVFVTTASHLRAAPVRSHLVVTECVALRLCSGPRLPFHPHQPFLSLQVIMWRVCVAKEHLGLHTRAASWRCFNATRLLAGWSRTKQRLPRCPWLAAGVLEQHSTDTQAAQLFSFFIWMEWNIYINERPRNTCTDKKFFFFFFKFSCKRKKSWFLSLNRFCTFCEICSESRTEVRMRPRTSPAHLPRNKQQNSQIKPTRVRRAGAHTQHTSVSSRCCQEVQTEADGRNSTEGSISNINAPKAKADIY